MVHDTPALLKAARAREEASAALADVQAQQPEIDDLTADVRRVCWPAWKEAPPVKTRTEQRTRTVPKTIDGNTHQVQETYTVELPVPPADRDAQALTAVTAIAGFIVLGAVVWSTVAIGALLAMVGPTWTAYMIAFVFDAAWIGCLVLEWINRYDPERARTPRKAG
ncbi:hypothetical protein [Streptomyces viridochromogenes]|nr:hypothetical protein [Streptomyces viridochromogenes]